ncbi:MAG TPA: hypothetical protein VFA09_20255 [Ktedonobacteraceae bacterium]|jgi:hypothetical protein|nr:hypothetical protein [Ktedonobacteraceae bacterium]
MNDGFRQIKIDPPLPCVYHGCDKQAGVAIVYEVSEREWRMVPTCEQHTVAVPGWKEVQSEVTHR